MSKSTTKISIQYKDVGKQMKEDTCLLSPRGKATSLLLPLVPLGKSIQLDSPDAIFQS
jgi:hypothetical protein